MEAASSKNFLEKFNHVIGLDRLSPEARKIVVGIIGGVLLLAGIAMIILPGPAFIVIPLGLAVLASEFSWAQRWLQKARGLFKKKRKKTSG
jgi:tellurite resistance protein TerC